MVHLMLVYEDSAGPDGEHLDSSKLTFDIEVDPGVQVFQAPVGVPTAVCPGVSRVCPPYHYRVRQSVLVQQTECSAGPMDRTVTMTTEGEGGAGGKDHLGLVWQEIRVQMDGQRTRRI